MPSDKPILRLEDIIENAEAIQRYIAGMDFATFQKDRKTHDAVERCLERISEAAAKLGNLAFTLMPDQPWQKIRALGNRLRHQYDAIREDRLWDIVHLDLPTRCADVHTLLIRDSRDSVCVDDFQASLNVPVLSRVNFM